MSDNVSITPGVGKSIATDEIDSVHYQRVKIVSGADGATDGIEGTAAFGLEADVTRLPGTVAADLTAIKDAIELPMALDAPTISALTPIPLTDVLTALAGLQTALAGVLAVAGTVGITGTVPVSGTFWQATQPVSEPDTRPATTGFAITPHDTNTLTATTRAIYVGGAGDVVVTLSGDGTTATTFKAVPAGTLLPIAATRVKTASTATLMLGLS